MPQYMLLLYAPESEEQEDRWAEMPLWRELTESLRKAGLLVANGPLHPATSATTVRVRGGETELTDGPFATTKEVLAGYYLLNCADVDEALRHAARMPTARYGSVEVRAIMNASEIPDVGRVHMNGQGAGGG
ncbi:YciI family protein [Microbispora sp. NPDC049125]|uniref:YciI family protein n=1 Tax=Microbispora sp. NPDC049125 TaxID=3154929 RepID=UPI0034673553